MENITYVSFLLGPINEVVAFLRHLVAVSWAAHVDQGFLDVPKMNQQSDAFVVVAVFVGARKGCCFDCWRGW